MNNINTYNGLLVSIPLWVNRNDQDFMNNVPIFISIAEQEFFIDCSTLGNEEYDIGNFTIGAAAFPRPALWGQSLTFSYIDDTGNVRILERVGYEYLRSYISNPNDPDIASILPKYYTDYGFNYILITPPPLVAFDYEFAYYKKITPLSLTQQANWITQNAYDAFFYNCLAQAYTYIQDDVQAQKFQGLYQQRVQAYKLYNRNRNFDRSADVTKD